MGFLEKYRGFIFLSWVVLGVLGIILTIISGISNSENLANIGVPMLLSAGILMCVWIYVMFKRTLK